MTPAAAASTPVRNVHESRIDVRRRSWRATCSASEACRRSTGALSSKASKAATKGRSPSRNRIRRAQIRVGPQPLLDGGALVFVEFPVDIGDEPRVLVILTHPSVPA